jgi:hypothetical protein
MTGLEQDIRCCLPRTVTNVVAGQLEQDKEDDSEHTKEPFADHL